LQLLKHASHQFAAEISTSFPLWEFQFGFALAKFHLLVKHIAANTGPHTAIT
jgi:hypothetical protein